MASPFRRTKLAESLSFDLTDPLASNVELLPDLFKGVLALAADAEAQPDHLLFLRRKCLQNVGSLVPHIGIDHRVDGRTYPAILDQVAQRRFAVAPDRR